MMPASVKKRYFSALDFHLAIRPHTVLRTGVRTYQGSEDTFRIEYIKKGRSCDDLFSPMELYIRDVMDGFLGRLERIESLIDSGVVGQKNFGDNFSYWLKIIGEPKKSGDSLGHFSNEKREALIEYIHHYEFSGVQRLFERYGKKLSLANMKESLG